MPWFVVQTTRGRSDAYHVCAQAAFATEAEARAVAGRWAAAPPPPAAHRETGLPRRSTFAVEAEDCRDVLRKLGAAGS